MLPPPQHEQARNPKRRADAAEDPQNATEHGEDRAPVVLLKESDHGKALDDPDRQAEEQGKRPDPVPARFVDVGGELDEQARKIDVEEPEPDEDNGRADDRQAGDVGRR